MGERSTFIREGGRVSLGREGEGHRGREGERTLIRARVWHESMGKGSKYRGSLGAAPTQVSLSERSPTHPFWSALTFMRATVAPPSLASTRACLKAALPAGRSSSAVTSRLSALQHPRMSARSGWSTAPEKAAAAAPSDEEGGEWEAPAAARLATAASSSFRDAGPKSALNRLRNQIQAFKYKGVNI